MVEPYELPDGFAIWHFDFYRFDDPREWEDAGFRDIFARPGPEARRMAGEGRSALLPPADLRRDASRCRRGDTRAVDALHAAQRRAAAELLA